MFTCDKLRVQNVLKNALEKLSGLKLQNFPGGACPQTPLAFARYAHVKRVFTCLLSAPLLKNIFLRHCIHIHFWTKTTQDNHKLTWSRSQPIKHHRFICYLANIIENPILSDQYDGNNLTLFKSWTSLHNKPITVI